VTGPTAQGPAAQAARPLVARVRAALRPGDRLARYAGEHRMAGHCYVASEALYHLLGGCSAGWRPVSARVGEVVHWWLEHADGSVLDPMADQFVGPINRAVGRGRGFLTRDPSRRAAAVMGRLG
jgi:hypothetical protein